MVNQDKALVRRLIEDVWSQGKLGSVDELVASDYVGHSSTETHGTDGYKHFFAALRGAFPDIQFTIEDQVAEGSTVVARWSARGTHLGAFAGLPPTGKQAATTGTTIYRIVGGKVAECWTHLDELGLLRQLGALQPASQAA